MAFGGTMIDANGPTRDLPIRSMVTGLVANALGWRRGERERHHGLQQRLVIGARLDRAGEELRDFQTAQLGAKDRGWTTRGEPEGRAGGADTYKSPHIRRRHYRADAFVTLALRLDPPDGSPTLDEVAAALAVPARPLFIGRKPCLPSRPVLSEAAVEAASVLDALLKTGIEPAPHPPRRRRNIPDSVRVILPPAEHPADYRTVRKETIADVRDWVAGVHAGETRLSVLALPRGDFPLLESEALP